MLISCSASNLSSSRRRYQEMLGQRQQMTGQVNVEVDAGPTQDLNAVLSEIREQYEQASAKNKKELDAWFQEKVGTEDATGQNMFSVLYAASCFHLHKCLSSAPCV